MEPHLDGGRLAGAGPEPPFVASLRAQFPLHRFARREPRGGLRRNGPSLLALVLSGCGSAGGSNGTDDPAPVLPTGGPAATAAPERTRGTVVSGEVAYVTDGDTIAVQIEGTLTRIRLIGIDAPESKHPTEPVEC